MKIAELFYSIQGEGALAGVPSVFIRASGCNLRCVWCDTPYTSWRPEGRESSVEEILSQIEECPTRYVVITGGEPMIAPDIVELTEELRRREAHITIETAGTVFAPVACDLMSISPKLANSTPSATKAKSWAKRHEETRIQPDVLRKLMETYPYQLKFVVSEPEDMTEVHSLVAELGADHDRVLLMPEGTTAQAICERGQWITTICKDTGFRYSPRLQIDLWGDRRGV